MSRSIELADEDYARLERAAETEGVTAAEWIARRIPCWADADIQSSEGQPVRTMADRLAGRIGSFHSGNGQPTQSLAERFAGRVGLVASGGDGRLSENTGETFTDILVEKRRQDRL